MVDIADQADDLIQAELEAGVKAAAEGRTGPLAHLRPKGFCFWCLEPIPLNRTHCAPADDSCAEDHEKHMRFAR